MINTTFHKERKGRVRFTAGMILTAILFAATAAATAGATSSQINQTIEDALQRGWGKISLNIRWRFEYVDQEGKGIARGDPIRIRLGYLTPKFSGFQAFAEFEGNTPVFLSDYNSTRNNKTQYPVIADPAEAELNQGWLAYSGIPDTTIKGASKDHLQQSSFCRQCGMAPDGTDLRCGKYPESKHREFRPEIRLCLECQDGHQ